MGDWATVPLYRSQPESFWYLVNHPRQIEIFYQDLISNSSYLWGCSDHLSAITIVSETFVQSPFDLVAWFPRSGLVCFFLGNNLRRLIFNRINKSWIRSIQRRHCDALEEEYLRRQALHHVLGNQDVSVLVVIGDTMVVSTFTSWLIGIHYDDLIPSFIGSFEERKWVVLDYCLTGLITISTFLWRTKSQSAGSACSLIQPQDPEREPAALLAGFLPPVRI